MISVELQGEIAALKEDGYLIRYVVEGSRVFIVFEDFQLPQGLYNATTTAVMVWTTIHYPSTGFDMFWTDSSLLLANNGAPRQAQCIQSFIGTNWRRFSIHPLQNSWNPNEHTLTNYLCYVQHRLNTGT